jgi:hypothetical protein
LGRTSPIENGFHRIDLRKASDGVSVPRDPGGKMKPSSVNSRQDSLLDKVGTSVTVAAPAARYWDV